MGKEYVVFYVQWNITQPSKNEIMPFAVAWMDLEVIILSEISQRQMLYDVTYVWTLKLGTHEHTYETKTGPQIEQTCGCQGWGEEELGVRHKQMQTNVSGVKKQLCLTV